jgi:hypothetical protein
MNTRNPVRLDDDDDHDYAPTTAPAPAANTAHAPAPEAKVRPITQRFSKWDAVASIRTKPRQRLSPPKNASCADLVLFSPDLVPIAAHAAVRERGLSSQIRMQHLFRYLHFTAILEQQYVNPAIVRIASRDLGLSLPNSMIIDAYRIYCDEGYHALCSADLAQQVIDFGGVAPISRSRPQAFTDLDTLIAGTPNDLKPLLNLAFVIVSETLISAILAVSHADIRVEPAVRQVILEHAQDEAVHSAYFSDLVKIIWPQLPGEMRSAMACAIPRLMTIFLSPDIQHYTHVLSQVGYTPQLSQQILGDCFPRQSVLDAIHSAGMGTIGLFESVGALDLPEVQDAYHLCGIRIA